MECCLHLDRTQSTERGDSEQENVTRIGFLNYYTEYQTSRFYLVEYQKTPCRLRRRNEALATQKRFLTLQESA